LILEFGSIGHIFSSRSVTATTDERKQRAYGGTKIAMLNDLVQLSQLRQ
jgi:hypothetical protein